MDHDLGEPAETAAATFRAERLRQFFKRFDGERWRRTKNLPASDDDPFEYRISPLCYPGLRSFDPTEDGCFFGRQRNISEIRKKLTAERMVVVQGGSGTGKSSVIRAGLFPRLRDSEAVEGRHGNWYAAEFRPRTAPLDNLAEGLARLAAREFPSQPAVLCRTLGRSRMDRRWRRASGAGSNWSSNARLKHLL